VTNKRLLGRIARENRALLISLAVLVAVNVVLYAAVILPTSRRVGNVTERTQEARNDRAAAAFANKQVAAALNGKSQAARQLDRFYRMVLPATLVDARRMVEPRLDLLARDADLKASDMTSELVKDRNHTLQEWRIHMTLTGDYAAVREFIHRLERSPEFLVIDRVVLKESAVDAAPLSLQVDLSTYFKEKAQ
jgi:hypothetical protein